MKIHVRTLLAIAAGTQLLCMIPGRVKAAIISSDILVFQQNTAGAAGVPIAIVDVNPGTQSNSTIAVNNLYTDSSGSEGSLSLSKNGTLLSFSGFTSTAATETSVSGRGAGTIDSSGNVVLPSGATYTNTTAASQARGSYSADGVNYYMTDKSGIFVNGSSGTAGLTGSNNTRSIKGYGGSTYVLQASSTTTIPVIATLTPAGATPGQTSVTVTGLPGLANDNNGLDFALVSSGKNGSSFDTLYYTASGTTGNNGILKYALIGGTWTAEGSDLANGGTRARSTASPPFPMPQAAWTCTSPIT